jgi:hypothetical protein
MALPTALFAMIASMALASAAILTTVDVQQGTTRDHDSKEAIAAADAGSGVALLRLNRFISKVGPTTPCVGPAGEQGPASADGWCPSSPVESVGNATYTYRVSPYSASGIYKVIAVGTSGIVSRRVEVGLLKEDGEKVFANEKLIGQDDITIGGNPKIETDIGTNGNIEGKGNSFTICGDVRHGLGKEAPTPSCGGEVSEGEKNLPPISVPADIATNNSNCRLAVTCELKSEVDTYTKVANGKNGGTTEIRTSKEPWEASTKTINVNSQGSTLSMGGRDYFVCKINLQSGSVIMPAGSTIRIFVDTPEHCGLAPGAVQVEISGNATITSTGLIPEQGTYNVPGIYVLGDGAVKLAGNPGNTDELMLYAPYSSVEIKGDSTWIGMIAAKRLTIPGNPTIKSDPNIKAPDEAFSSLLARTRYVECTGATPSPPDAEC